jgi:histidinol-phosphate aminotransferase
MALPPLFAGRREGYSAADTNTAGGSMTALRRPPFPATALSRRDVLARLGWGSSAVGLLGAAPLPDFGELRLPELRPHQQPADSAAIRLSSNENPYGLFPAGIERLQAEIGNANRYPFVWGNELIGALATHLGVRQSNITLGAGSTELLRGAAVAWGERAVLQAEPTFETLGMYARGAGHTVHGVPLTPDGRHDLDAMQSAWDAAGLIYVCNPSNPSSTLVAQSDLDAFLDAVPGDKLVVVDEAYHEFVTDPDYRSQVDRAVNSDNVVVLRTFSKVYGMAGMRVGYAVGPAALIRQLEARVTELSVGVLSAACATASLGDAAHAAEQARLNSANRAILLAGLQSLGLEVWDSQTNFVMVELGRDMLPVNQAMAAEGVLVGRLFPAVPTKLRISVGTPEQMHRCVEALAGVLA